MVCYLDGWLVGWLASRRERAVSTLEPTGTPPNRVDNRSPSATSFRESRLFLGGLATYQIRPSDLSVVGDSIGC